MMRFRERRSHNRESKQQLQTIRTTSPEGSSAPPPQTEAPASQGPWVHDPTRPLGRGSDGQGAQNLPPSPPAEAEDPPLFPPLDETPPSDEDDERDDNEEQAPAPTPNSRRDPDEPSRDKPPTVYVFGAGIAGLTAAQELAERGFKVTVFEAKQDRRFPRDPSRPEVQLGGLAATQYVEAANVYPFDAKSHERPRGNFITGEHGFRFFPAYYLHIWDTLRRIPIYDDVQDLNDAEQIRKATPTARTVYDNVQRVIAQAGTAPSGQPSLVVPREAPRSIAELFGSYQELWQLGYTPNDLSSFYGRMSRYLVTSSRRRERDFEEMSTYDYLVGMNKKTKTKDFYYSQAFESQIVKAPRILAAFDARHGDARTNLNTYVQLNMSLDRYDSKADGVLNGPTTTAWFDHWYVHLRKLGVTFTLGALRGLKVVVDAEGNASLRAYVVRGERNIDREDAALAPESFRMFNHENDDVPARAQEDSLDDKQYTESAEYYVVATDAYRAELATAPLRDQLDIKHRGVRRFLWGRSEKQQVDRQRLRNLSTVLGLEGFTTTAAPDDDAFGPTRGDARNPMDVANMGVDPWDRFQTLSGIQFFFDTEFQVLNGHVYYSTSDWGLSSINQTGLWLDRPRLEGSGYSSIMSVDIGEWHTKSRETNKLAIDSTRRGLAEEVWRQVSCELGASLSEKRSLHPGSEFPRPKWFSVDTFLHYDGDDQPPTKNYAPYLVPIKGDWKNRPGAYPWNPSGSSPTWIPTKASRKQQEQLDVWQAKHGGYQVHNNKLVFAGTWTKTFTRMTSMEAACESARHAVNAILDHYLYAGSKETDARKGDPLAWRMPYGFVDQELSTPVRFPTPAGDYCFVYDVENREPSDARPTRLLDAEYFVQGLPHPWTLAGIDQAAATASGAGPFGVAANYYDPVWVIEQLRQSRRMLEMLYSPPESRTNGEYKDPEDERSPAAAGLYCRSAMLPTDEGADPKARLSNDLWMARPLRDDAVDFGDALHMRRGNRPGQYS